MPTYIDLTNLSPATIAALSSTAPTITQVQITTSGYVVKDDTAISTSGGYIKITGTNFTAGSQVVIGSVTATSVTFVNSTTLNVQVPAQVAGTYIIYVTVSNGGVAILVNGLTYSGDPTWVTGSTLPAGQVNSAISIQFSATGDAPVTYALQAGSSLPPGITLTSGGLLSGTVTGITSQTTYNFTVEAIDAQSQESPRAFSITIAANDENFDYVTALLSASNPTSTFVTDASTNNFSVNIFGDARPNNFGPYTPGYYSNYFTSTNAFTVPDNAAWDLNTDITIEAFCYLESYNTSDQYYIVSQVATGQRAWAFGVSNGTLQIYYTTNGSTDAFINSNSFTVTAGQWYHFAFTRTSAGVYTFYVNGVATGSTTNAATIFTSNQPLTIGQFGNFGISTLGWKGFISNLRIVRGSIVYNGNFTPSTTPLTAITNTALLTCQSNRLIDNSTNNFTITNFSVTVSGFDPFAPNSGYTSYGSGYFDGTGDYLTVADTTNIQPGTGDCTWEAWLYPLSLPSAGNFETLWAQRADGNGWGGAAIVFNSSGNYQYFIANAAANNWQVSGGSTGFNVILNQWQHIALVRSGNTVTMYLNGVAGTPATVATGAIGTSGNLSLMAGAANGVQTVDGYMSNFRFVKGTAVYTSNFTPSNTPLTAITNTQLLTLQNNQPNNNNMFVDNSTNNLLATRVGNATQGSFNPYAGVYSVFFNNSSFMNTQSTSGAFVSIANNTGYDLGTGDFTMEGWIYPLSLPSSDNWPSSWFQTSSLFGRGTPNLGDGYNLILGATKLIFQNNDSQVTNGNHNITVNQWYHVAACRSSGTLRLYVNGTQVATASFSSSVAGGSNWYIGTETGQGAYFNGYMSNIRLLKGTALYTGSSFTVPTSPLLPITNTTLLTLTDNRLADDSANAPTVTANNGPTIQRFSPFPPQTQATVTTYSNLFNTGRLSVADATPLNLAGGVYTIEAWIYPYGDYSTWNQIVTKRSGATSSCAWQLALQVTTGYLAFYNGTVYASSSTPIARTWNHVAGVYDGTNINLYLNGSRVLQTAVSNTNVATSVTIGSLAEGSEPLRGLISNLRITKGGQLYTGTTYTVPTAPLTTSVSQGTVSLLTCQSTTLIDNSVNAYTITPTGTVYSLLQNPNGFTNPSISAYTPISYGGGLYFDGNGDNLTFSDNDAFEIGSSQFTIECWVYPNSLKGYQGILGKTGAADGNGWILYFESNNSINFNTGNGAVPWTVSLNGGTTVPAGQWSHIAVTKDSSNVYRMFVNGLQVATTTNAFTTNQTSGLFYIGKWPYFPSYANTMDFGGYISDVRIVKGQSLYTGNFIPTSVPLTAVANTTLLVNGTSAAIYDSAMITTYETVADARSTGVIKKYGNSSLSFDGTGDALYAPWVPSLELGSGNFTIEFWAYITGGNSLFCWSADFHYGMTFNYGGATGNRVGVWASSNGSTWNIFNADGGGNGISTGTITNNSWTHVALVRNGSAWALYLNGTSAWTGTSSATIISRNTDIFRIGGPWPGAGPTNLNGYIDDWRITTGVARYTANFTPPTSPVIQF